MRRDGGGWPVSKHETDRESAPETTPFGPIGSDTCSQDTGALN